MTSDLHAGNGTTVTSLVGGIMSDAQELIKQQAALIRAEVREELQKTKEAALLLACGVIAAMPAGLLLCFGIVYLLQWAFPALDLWAAFLIVGGMISLACAALMYAGVKKLQSLHPIPDRSLATLRENLRWTTNPKCTNPS